MKKLLKIMTIAIVCSIGIISIKADTISYNYKQYRIQYYSLGQGTTAWTSWTNFNTSSTLSGDYGVQTMAVRFGYSTKFTNGTTYRIVIEGGFSPSETINQTFLNVNGTPSCYGSSTSTWSNDASLVECIYIGAIRVTGTNHVKYMFDVTPTANIYGFQFNIGFAGTSQVNTVNVYNKSTITSGQDIEGAINEQTIIIKEEIEKIEDVIEESITNILDEDHEYENADITEDVEDLEGLEENIKENLNLDTTGKLTFWWNTTYLNWIWTKANYYFSNSWLQPMFTSFMALGIIKLILGR